MAIINSILCTDGSEYALNFSGQSLNTGTFVTAVDTFPPRTSTILLCVEITSNIDEPSSLVSATTETYSSCYDCLINTFSKIRFNPCGSDYPYDPPLFNLTDFGYILQPGQIFNLEFTIDDGRSIEVYSGCFDVEGTFQLSEDDYNAIPVSQLATLSQIFFSNYTTCDECLNGFSAGTEYASCTICCPCGSGSTVTESILPHPVATNLFGQSVVQLNAVQLGGSNGLYA